MRLCFSSILVPTVTLTAIHAAHAETSILQPAWPPIDDSYSTTDWAWSYLAGTAGGAVGALALGSLSYAASGACVDDGERDGFLGNCFDQNVAPSVVGRVVGSTFRGAGGIYLYGELSGHRGRY